MAAGDGSYRVVNVNSGLDLEVSTSSGGTIDQWQESGSARPTNAGALSPSVMAPIAL
jgi:hypothetical protein